MKARKMVATVSIAVMLAAAETVFPRSIANAQMVNPNTPEAAKVAERIDNAERLDGTEELKWEGLNDSIAHSYAEKEGRAQDLRLWMELGHPVSEQDVDQTLNDQTLKGQTAKENR